MRKKVVAIGIALAALISANAYCHDETEAEQNAEITFQDYDWLIPIDDVVDKIEADGWVSGKDFQVVGSGIGLFNQDVAGYDCDVYFDCTGDIFIGGSYILSEEHTNPQQYYLDYCDLAEKLETIYGEPDAVKEEWLDDLYKDDENGEGMAIITGGLSLYEAWVADDGSSVMITCRGDNYECSTVIAYRCANFTDYNKKNTKGL